MSRFISQLRQPSFRGLSFELPTDEKTFGRRWQTHEYPGKDTPGHENMGAGINAINITAIIGGDNFITDADAFEAALMKDSPGTLIHPHYGELQVICKDGRRSHSATNVGDVVFSITFEKYGEPSYPSALGDTVIGLDLAAGNLFTTLKSEFTNRLQSTLLPDFVTSDGVERINALVGRLRTVLSNGGLASLFEFPTFGSLGLGIVDNIIGLFQEIAGSAKPASRPVIGNVAIAAPTDALKIMRAMNSIVSTAPVPVTGAATQSRGIRTQNAEAIDGMFRGCAAACLASTARYATYESKEDAIALRNATHQSISGLRDFYALKGWDDSWHRTGNVLIAVSRDVNDRIGRLPRTVLLKPATVRTSLDMAQRLYGDDPSMIFARAEDLCARNKIGHPGFIPARKLEALIDE